MKKEAIEARLQIINKNIEQLIANYNMLLGGKEECLFWLKQLDEQIEVSSKDAMELHELKKVINADSIEVIEKTG